MASPVHPLEFVFGAGAIAGQVLIPAMPLIPRAYPQAVLGFYYSGSASAPIRIFFGEVAAPAADALALVWVGDAQWRSIPCIYIPRSQATPLFTMPLRFDKAAGPTGTLWLGWGNNVSAAAKGA